MIRQHRVCPFETTLPPAARPIEFLDEAVPRTSDALLAVLPRRFDSVVPCEGGVLVTRGRRALAIGNRRNRFQIRGWDNAHAAAAEPAAFEHAAVESNVIHAVVEAWLGGDR